MSTKLYFCSNAVQHRLHTGPLAEHVDSFASWLFDQGYSREIARTKLRLTGVLSRWLEERALDLSALDELLYGVFLAESDAKRLSPEATGRQLLGWLRANGLIGPAAVRSDDNPITQIQLRYERYLRDERGVRANTVRVYLQAVGVFLRYTFSTKSVDLEFLSLNDVNGYIRGACSRYKPATTKTHVVALRSFLGYLHRCGDIPVDISDGIFSVRNWRLSSLPKALEPSHVEALIASCDISTAVGRRDRAILLLLARLGLRACEIVWMTLDDFDWFGSVITVTGKGGRRDRLPLPHDVGEAVAAYLLDGRPKCSTRRVFVTTIAPYRGFQASNSIGKLFYSARKRAGLNSLIQGGTHLLRHSLATQMLRNGASLEEIGQILRHDCADSTRIYAKVDLDSLRPLAPAWPTGAL